MRTIFGVLILCVSAACGLWFQPGAGPEWDSLRITWGPNPLSSNYFVKQPLTVQEAKAAGFEPISTGCGGKFLGQRYMRGNDVSLILIYDSKDNVAGIQMGLPKSLATPYYNFTQQKLYNNDTIGGTDVYILTAYFVDPKTICPSNDIPNRKVGTTGTGLWIQNGTDPIQDSVSIPLSQEEVNQTRWVQGRCFVSMGVHYWYDNRLDTDCNVMTPAFLMYNKGKLTGFGWANIGKYDYTKHVEYPPLSALSSFLAPVPDCMPEKFNQTGGFTTMHIYFNVEPWNLLC